MKKFTIDRSKWARGSLNGCLLEDTGQMCSLGFALNQICKISKTELLFQSTPKDVLVSKNTIFTFLDTFSSYIPEVKDKPFVDTIIEINDSNSLTDKQREKMLTRLFKKQNIKVTFI